MFSLTGMGVGIWVYHGLPTYYIYIYIYIYNTHIGTINI